MKNTIGGRENKINADKQDIGMFNCCLLLFAFLSLKNSIYYVHSIVDC